MSRKLIVVLGVSLGFALRAIFGDPNAPSQPKPDKIQPAAEQFEHNDNKPPQYPEADRIEEQ